VGMLLSFRAGGHHDRSVNRPPGTDKERCSPATSARLAASGDTAAPCRRAAHALESHDASLTDYWKQWAQEQAAGTPHSRYRMSVQPEK